MTLSPQLKAAFVRAVLGAALTFVVATATALLNGMPASAAVSAGIAAAVSYVLARGGLEGFYDSKRAATGNVKPGDVTAANAKPQG